MTVAVYVAQWLATRTARLAPNARNAYRSALECHVLPAFGAVELADLKTAAIRDWLGHCLAKGHKRNSVEAFHTAFSTVLTDALIDGLVESNPAHGASIRLWPRKEKTVPKAMNAEELAAFCTAADLETDWLGAFVRIDVRSGLRLGEMLALRRPCLEPERRRIQVDRHYHGSGRFGPPKGGRTRVVEVSIATMELLLGRVTTGRPYLFTGKRGLAPMSLSGVEHAFRRAITHAGLPEHFTVHSLRHTYASMLLAAGAPATWVQQQMGHASYGITVDLYGSWLPQSHPEFLGTLEEDGAAPVRHPPRPMPRRGVVLPFHRHGS